MPGEFIGLAAVLCIFGIPIISIWTSHQRRMLELQLQLRNQGDSGLRTEFDALRHEVRSMRDTCTQYDLSFDAALQRMERRVEGIERTAQSSQTEDRFHVGVGR
jgi:hypothetical protein